MGTSKTLKETLIKMIKKRQIREQICNMLISEAQEGNLKAFEIIRDIIGEKNNQGVSNIEQVSHIKIEVVDAKTN